MKFIILATFALSSFASAKCLDLNGKYSIYSTTSDTNKVIDTISITQVGCEALTIRGKDPISNANYINKSSTPNVNELGGDNKIETYAEFNNSVFIVEMKSESGEHLYTTVYSKDSNGDIDKSVVFHTNPSTAVVGFKLKKNYEGRLTDD